jgi:ABC-type transport system involved in multi-copper enzyme maturation permease subunit
MTPTLTIVPHQPINVADEGQPGAFSIALGNIWTIGQLVIKELYRRKDFYALFIITALITLTMGSVNFFNEGKVVRYLKEICLFFIWVSSLVIAITTSARQIPAERESRTLFPLLAKPVTRNQFVLGKFVGCWMACGICLAVFYTFFGAVSAAREHSLPLLSYVQAGLLHWFMLAIVIAMTIGGSIIFAAPSSNGTIVFVSVTTILILGRHINKFALQLSEPLQTSVYAIYYAIPHLELFDVRDLVIHNWGAIPWVVWLGAVLYASVYTGIFLAGACFAFRRKGLN